MKRSLLILISMIATLGSAGVAGAQITRKAAKETAEYVAERFGRKAATEGTEALARRIEQTAMRHGDDVIKAVRQVGPRSLHIIEEAGTHGKAIARVIATHGEEGVVWIATHPQGLALFLRHGDGAARVLVKHQGLAAPVIEQLGLPGIRALEATGVQNARRLAMMADAGELAKIGRSQELLGVIARFGDAGMEFVWRNKGSLAISTCLAAFLVDPEPFIRGTKELAGIVGETAVKPLVVAGGQAAVKAVENVSMEVGRRTNWTLVIVLAVASPSILVAAYLWRRRRRGGSSFTSSLGAAAQP